MIDVRLTETFRQWLKSLRDKAAAEKIAQRILRLQSGLLGDVKPVGEGVSELRINTGAGYRVYFVQRGKTLIIVMCGGDKGTQTKDIRKAKEMAANL